MKLSNPRNRYNLNIKRNEKVLEVGGGHSPHPRANIVVDKFIDFNFHRSGDINLYKGQKFVQADGRSLPFSDKEFDYVICNQVLEHVDNPSEFLDELGRVGKRGYIETPSLIGEHLHPKSSHRWVILEIDSKIVLFEKDRIFSDKGCDFGPLFLTYLLKHSLAYKLLNQQFHQIRNVQYEWADKIDYVINPQDEYFSNYLKQWDEKRIQSIIPLRSRTEDILSLVPAFFDIIKFQFKKRFVYGKMHPLEHLYKAELLSNESQAIRDSKINTIKNREEKTLK